MTPQEALQLLDSLAAQTQTSRQTHAQLAEAIAVLTAAIEPRPE